MTTEARITASGKYFYCGEKKWLAKGLSYGPFAPNAHGEFLPDAETVRRDFAHMRSLGANLIRVYHIPAHWFLDIAAEFDLRVFVDVPWDKHRCFFEDWNAQEEARNRVRETARSIGNHAAIFGISVVNEIPVDVIRFQGRKRVEKFIAQLAGIVNEEAPECLTTFTSFPTTEFLEVEGADFFCFNVYLHDESEFSQYLDRLQHIAGNLPLMLGEYGIDSSREGEVEQARILKRHLKQVFRRGLAGSVVFAYTDDWFTGGRQIEDWFFGVTDRERNPKPAANALQNIWTGLPSSIREDSKLPKVSVVVCSYNGEKTLRGCLDSLMRLDYPDYEVIVVNDGSTDQTASIAAEFPQLVYIKQENRGLSVARNVGARQALGEIVAYTDDDCVVDADWLRYLVTAMEDQQVQAIGGPNITPDNDGWVARCIAASPGNPSHVMLDDQHAEHVPGCNMAFRRSTLLGVGGFDPQFRAAGDDVDICWRLLDANLPIGYAPGAMVWHHRRATVTAFGKQQKGYGRSEAMVHFKHPQRFGAFGRSTWRGIIYGDGAVGLPLMPDRIYHGQFGDGLFQSIYRHNTYGAWAIVMSVEWHFAAIFLLVLAILFPPFAIVSAVMWCGTVGLAIRSAARAPLSAKAPWWGRPLVTYLYFMQPIWRGYNRLTHLLRNKQHPKLNKCRHDGTTRRKSRHVEETFWDNHNGLGRQELLTKLVENAASCNWAGDYDNAWADWDVKLIGDPWHDITITTATEELGWPRRFTRARCELRPTGFNRSISAAAIIWLTAAFVSGQWWAVAVGILACLAMLVRIWHSRSDCFDAAQTLIGWASIDARFSGEKAAEDAKEQHRSDTTVEDNGLQSHDAQRQVNGRDAVEPIDATLQSTSEEV